MTLSRRRWLTSAAATALFSGLSHLHAATPRRDASLQPVADEHTGLPLLKLPPGFRYRSMNWSQDPMKGGVPTPHSHDGMAAFAGRRRADTVLLRNHEQFLMPAIAGRVPTYDRFADPAIGVPGMGGGVTALELRSGKLRAVRPRLAGTAVNCAGGPTPWGSWLTCEEVVWRGSRYGGKDHGYVFEVPARGRASARPIKDMGLFRHEAVAIDPDTGIAYLTEDNGPRSGFYRYIPNNRSPRVGALEDGGRLEMLRVPGLPNADLGGQTTGVVLDVAWVPIEDPDMDPEGFQSFAGSPDVFSLGRSGPYLQGEAQGAAQFRRGEGCWYFDGRIYWADTAGGPVEGGTVWCYDPNEEKLLCFFSSTDFAVADAIDNITLTPGGTIIACEDNGGLPNGAGEVTQPTRLLAIAPGGEVRVVGQNNVVLDEPPPARPNIKAGDYRSSEWAGACFSPDGSTLFVNIQKPGITLAIEGPWAQV